MKTLEEIEKQIAQIWSIQYQGWTMMILEGERKDYRYKHQCNNVLQFVTPVVRVCETCKTPMPDAVWEHFRKTQQFIEPERDALNGWDGMMEKIRPFI